MAREPIEKLIDTDFSLYLKRHLGSYVLCEYLINSYMVKRQGILERLEKEYLVLYDPIEDMRIVCSYNNLEFVYIYNELSRPNNRHELY